MVVTTTENLGPGSDTVSTDYDRKSELKAFDDSKAGVQGLVENGVTKVPRMFYCGQSNNLSDGSTSSGDSNSKLSVPTIDLTGIIHGDDHLLRDEAVEKVRHACEKWGFFQVTNHGIPTHVLDEMIQGTCRFHQQDANVRKQYYTRDLSSRKVVYLSNFTLYQDPSADWRDTLACFWAPHPPKPEELPAVCSDVVIEYSTKVMALASDLLELMSEALGLNRFT
uniref:Non-haem dioxygenase N-terminal domain-containing protein n=1 Tax=Lotus japonicus TaxID=34305 RepID=I3SHY4_LOTJA|nr:unknown [Lotus japonicus]